MDALSEHSDVRDLTLMKGSQIGASEAGLNWIGYVIEHAPAPMMVVQPTDFMAKRFSNQRLKNLISSAKVVSEKVIPVKHRDSGNTMLLKEFEGGILLLVGANSAASLSSVPIQLLFFDEPDRYPIDLPGEGDPIKLAEARTRTFPRRKIFRASTPTIDIQSQIQQSYELGDQRKYLVPCPHCEHPQEITWEKIQWKNHDPTTAHMKCEKCGEKIREAEHKTEMLRKGVWVPSRPSTDARTRSYHLSSLYSPLGWYSWSDAVREFLAVHKNEVRLRVFVNTVLGLPWKAKGEAPEWRKLFDRREAYPFNQIPAGAGIVTAGVDVQKDRLEVEIVAWGPKLENWSIDYRTYAGDTSTLGVYSNLDTLLAENFPVVGRNEFMQIRALTIDTGFNTQTVYNYARGKGTKVIPTKGIDGNMTLVARPSYVDVDVEGKIHRRGLALWTVGTNIAKTELYSSLMQEKPKEGEPVPAGWCHFPQYDEGFFKMLTAEEMRKKVIRGYARYVWEKIRERNEALDCRILARVAAHIIGIDRFTPDDWENLLGTKKNTESVAENSNLTVKQGMKFRKSSYWGD